MQNNHRFVVHIDILGMRAMVKRDAEMAWRVLSGLANVRDYIAQLELGHITSARRELLASRVYSVMFSDTIVLFTKTDSNDDLQAVLIATGELLHNAFLRCVPVRIGIASGQFFFNIEDSLYSGPALIEAYELGESAQWIGIATTEAIYSQAKKAGFKSGDDDIVVPAKIPTVGSQISGYALNWVAAYRHTFKVCPPISVELFYSQFEHAFGPYSGLSEREQRKYANTTCFINEHLARLAN
jgi:hypothetical protein